MQRSVRRSRLHTQASDPIDASKCLGKDCGGTCSLTWLSFPVRVGKPCLLSHCVAGVSQLDSPSHCLVQEFKEGRRASHTAPQVLFSHREPPLELKDTDAAIGDNIGYITFGKWAALRTGVARGAGRFLLLHKKTKKEFTFLSVQAGRRGLKGLWNYILLHSLLCPFAASGHLSSAVGRAVWKWTASHLVSANKISSAFGNKGRVALLPYWGNWMCLGGGFMQV